MMPWPCAARAGRQQNRDTKSNSLMRRKSQIPLRTFLEGIGTAVSLPLLEAMAPPVKLFGATSGGGANSSSHPTRMPFVYVPNGVNMTDWTAEG
jgi:hypothetical protein